MLTVADLADLLVFGDGQIGGRSVLSQSLRSQIATSLRRIAEALAEAPTTTDEIPQVSNEDVAESVREARRVVPQDDQEMLANGVLLELRRAANALAEIRH